MDKAEPTRKQNSIRFSRKKYTILIDNLSIKILEFGTFGIKLENFKGNIK